MRKVLVIRIGVLLLAVMLCLPAAGGLRKRKVKSRSSQDTVALTTPQLELRSSGKMSSSAYPVKISITGRVVQIQSDRSQLLPIYTNTGVLYMTARLNKGTNWIGGLPRGRYFINNRPITIQ